MTSAEVMSRFDYSSEEFGKSKVLRLLRRLARRSKRARRFLEIALEPRPKFTKPPRRAFTFEMALSGVHIPLSFMENLPDEQRKELASLLLTTTDEKLARHLSFALHWKDWPLDITETMALIDDSDDVYLRGRRLHALRATTHPVLRAWALANLREPSGVQWDFLEENAQPSDVRDMEAAFLDLRNRGEEFHSASSSILNMAKDKRIKISASTLNAMLEYNNCPLCRYSAFRELVKRRRLSDTQIIEAIEDADPDFQKSARRVALKRSLILNSRLKNQN